MVEIRNTLKKQFGADLNDNGKQKYHDVIKKNNEEEEEPKEKIEELNRTLITLFNYFEGIAVGIKNHTLDKEICYQFVGFTSISCYKWAEEFIEDCKKFDSTIWSDLTDLVEEWEERAKNDKRKANPKGKEPTG